MANKWKLTCTRRRVHVMQRSWLLRLFLLFNELQQFRLKRWYSIAKPNCWVHDWEEYMYFFTLQASDMQTYFFELGGFVAWNLCLCKLDVRSKYLLACFKKREKMKCCCNLEMCLFLHAFGWFYAESCWFFWLAWYRFYLNTVVWIQ